MKKVFILFGLFWAITLYLFAGGAQELTPEKDDAGFSVISIADMTVKWKIQGESINIALSAPTNGWVAVGFNPSSVMKDANLIIGYIKEGEVTVEDHFGSGTFSHANDVELGGTRNITNISGSEEGKNTKIEFSMPLSSGDRYDTALTPGEKHLIILAHGSNNADNVTSKHANRTKFVVTL